MRRVALLAVLLAGCPTVEPLPFDDDDFTLGPTDDDDSTAGDDDDSTAGDDDDSTAGDDDDAAATLSETSLPPCASPVAAPGAYSDGLPGSGITFIHQTDPAWVSTNQDLVSAFAEVVATGVAAGDLDGDGAVDLFFTQSLGPSRFFWGNGDGTFVAGDTVLPEAVTGIANTADFDGDGDLDLLVGGREHLRLFRNDGARSFTDVSDATGIIQPLGWAGGSSWADFDGDGALDLYAGGYVVQSETDGETFWTGASIANILYRQESGMLLDRRAFLGPLPDEDGQVLHAVWRDLDHDGDPDLVQVNDFGDLLVNTLVWENVGPGDGEEWLFSERGVSGGVPYMSAPMGCLAADLDGDGWEELWFSDFGSHYVLRATDAFEWVDVTTAWMLTVFLLSDDASWSVLGTDLDGDGQLEIFVPYGPIPSVFNGSPANNPNQPDRVLVNEAPPGGPPDFRERQDDVLPGPQDGLSRGVAEADFNGDGVPDLVVPHVGAPPSLLLGQCTANRRLVVDLRDPTTGNTHAVGARVTVTTNGLSQTRTMDAGSRGTFSGSEPALYFGLGGGDSPVRLEVQWPWGATSVFEDVCEHCRVRVTREEQGR